MMVNKILYIVPLELDSSSSTGVIKKIRQQAIQWLKNGKNVTIAYISNSQPSFPLLEHEIRISYSVPGRKFSSIYFNRIISTFKLLKVIKKIKPDIIYTRYSFYWPFSNLLYKNNTSIVEMNTNDLVEYRKSSRLFNRIYLSLRKYYLGTKEGAVCVSPEIVNTIKCNGLEKVCLPNGYDFSGDVDFVTFSKDHTRNNRIVFISSPEQPWQGVDKILRLADLLPSYRFDIIGWEQTNFETKSNVKFHGFLPESEFKKLMIAASYAIGPLALHRKSMDSTSALKTSTYLQYNLPIIQSYSEVGLDIMEILVLDNKEDNINYSSLIKIKEFFHYWATRNVDLNEVKNMVGIERIEKERLQFFDLIRTNHQYTD